MTKVKSAQKATPKKYWKNFSLSQGECGGGRVASTAQDCWGAQGGHADDAEDADDADDDDVCHENVLDDDDDDSCEDDDILGEGSGGVWGGEAGRLLCKSYSGNFFLSFLHLFFWRCTY